MDTAQKKQYIFGGFIAAAVLVMLVAVFVLLSRTDIKDISMNPSPDMGWEYELITGSETRPVSPELIDDFTVGFPGETCRAVKASRTINEQMDGAQLGVYLYDAVCGVDVLLGGEMLYTSFEGAPRDEAGFVVTDGLAPASSETTEFFLPDDYLGKELTVITYFPAETDQIIPVFPYMTSIDASFAITSVENVPPVAGATLCAILAFLTALVYVLDISNGKPDKKVLLLTLFYFMLTIQQAFSSLAGSYSVFTDKLNMLDFICELYMAPLLMFAAFSLTSWRRWILASATGAWFVYDFIRLIRYRIMYGPFFAQASAPIILLLYALAAAFAIVEIKLKKRERPAKSDLVYVGIAIIAIISRIIIKSAEWGGNIGVYMQQVLAEPLAGYFYPLMLFVSYVCAVTVTSAVIIEFVKRTLRTRELINVLSEQNRYAMESYRRIAASEEATYAARHEMRHHMVVLSGMLQEGDTDKAREYAAALTDEYDELPKGRYSKNTMVNIIAGTYLEQAKSLGVETEYSLNLPETLPIADTDLCVFITNMFENALNACEKVDASEKRYIKTKMYIKGNYLFIGCANSAHHPEAEAKKSRTHGYGLENMKRIAEKYGGVVKIDRDNTSFSLKSGFYMKKENI